MLTKEHIEEYKKLDAENKVDWLYISQYQKLSEDFIRAFQDKNQISWTWISQYQKLSESFIREFKDKIDWDWVSYHQKLSESFIREFKDQVNWICISKSQKLSEEFIIEFKDKVHWLSVSNYQKLSESFITEFKDKIDWDWISRFQKLSESFIIEFKDKVNWDYIYHYQKLSESFIQEFKDKIYVDIQLKNHHDIRTIEQKRTEMKKYAKKHKLKFENDILYAFREHDHLGRGVFNKTIFYESGQYYRDWRCDLNPKNQNSFGFGIWPTGNTPVQITVEDWGCVVKNDEDGKARVFGITVC